jgi:hypothetical protein
MFQQLFYEVYQFISCLKIEHIEINFMLADSLIEYLTLKVFHMVVVTEDVLD